MICCHCIACARSHVPPDAARCPAVVAPRFAWFAASIMTHVLLCLYMPWIVAPFFKWPTYSSCTAISESLCRLRGQCSTFQALSKQDLNQQLLWKGMERSWGKRKPSAGVATVMLPRQNLVFDTVLAMCQRDGPASSALARSLGHASAPEHCWQSIRRPA